MKGKEYLKKAKPWLLPPRVDEFLRRRILAPFRHWEVLKLVAPNARFRGIHSGGRCFILCTGPSIREEDLSGLKGEICFGTSNFYKHPQYAAIRPRYHCIADTGSPHDPEEISAWFKEIDRATAPATLFIGARSAQLIRERGLFAGRDLNYLALVGPADAPYEELDASKILYSSHTISLAILMLACFMGFERIHLLGVDHTDVISGQYRYFYKTDETILKTPGIDRDGTVRIPRRTQLRDYAFIFDQYERLRVYAEARGIRITNLSRGSFLDVFPQSTLPEVLGAG